LQIRSADEEDENMAASSLPPYGPAIHQARESGDLEEMRKAAAEGEAYLAEHGDVPQAYEQLKAEIDKLEGADG
jgi:hypothetical protein